MQFYRHLFLRGRSPNRFLVSFFSRCLPIICGRSFGYVNESRRVFRDVWPLLTDFLLLLAGKLSSRNERKWWGSTTNRRYINPVKYCWYVLGPESKVTFSTSAYNPFWILRQGIRLSCGGDTWQWGILLQTILGTLHSRENNVALRAWFWALALFNSFRQLGFSRGFRIFWIKQR